MAHILSAVIVAAGKGLRFKKSLGGSAKADSKSKALVSIEGVPLFVQTLKSLSILPVSQWVVVVQESERQFFEEAAAQYLEFPVQFVHGGARRQDSVRRGVNTLNSCDHVFVHDAARPHLDPLFLNRLLEVAKAEDAVIPVLPMVETIKEISSDGTVLKTHDRSRFVRVQTPQFFRYELICKAHEVFRDSDREFTDDAAMVEAIGISVKTCEGSLFNIKVTTVEDLQRHVS